MSKRQIYMDLETTGLELRHCDIIEIGIALVEDYEIINFIAMPVAPLRFLQHLKDNDLDPFIQRFHGSDGSGLFDKINMILNAKNGNQVLAPHYVQEVILSVLDSWDLPKGQKALKPHGSSVHYDRKFLDYYYPLINNRFHYRIIDSSSTMENIRETNPLLWKAIDNDPSKAKEGNHTVMSDIEYSIDIQRRIDKHVFDAAEAMRRANNTAFISKIDFEN